VLIENPWTRELIAAVPTDEAEAMLLARGLVKAAGVKAVKKDDITPEKSPITGTPAAQAKGRGGKKPKTSAAQASAQIAAAMQAQEGANPGADAQGIDGAGEQPVATSAAVAPGVAQAGMTIGWPMPERV
jgi:hypothetical protein